jgi:hypothetical protein
MSRVGERQLSRRTRKHRQSEQPGRRDHDPTALDDPHTVVQQRPFDNAELRFRVDEAQA